MNIARSIAQERRDQSGINMVDLMMWLVIAALLLAAALQGISYYQQAAYLSNMKSDAAAIGTKVIAEAAKDEGIVNITAVNNGVAETKFSADTAHSVESPSTSGRKPYVRVTHPGVTDKDVIYIFDSCGEDYAVGVNVIPKAGTPALEACGVSTPVTNPGDGTSGQTGVGFEPLSEIAASNTVSNAATLEYMNNALAMEASPEYLALYPDWADEQYNQYLASPSYLEYTSSAFPATVNDIDNMRTDLRNDPTYIALNNDVWDKEGVLYTEATEGNQRAYVDADRALYAYLLSTPHSPYRLVAAPNHTSGFADKTAVAGTNTPVTITVALPTATVAGKAVTLAATTHASSNDDAYKVNSNAPTLVDGEYSYWNIDVYPIDGMASGTWEAGKTYTAVPSVRLGDVWTSHQYFETFTITVP